MRLLLAPIVVTPTKALTPSHVKGLLWLDTLYKGTSLLHDVTYLWNLRPYNVAAQTLEYWEYLDRTVGDADYSTWSEWQLSEPYIRMHAEKAMGDFASLRPYIERVERDGYVHPASRRLIEIWGEHFERLNCFDPGLDVNDPPGMTVDEVVDALSERGLCLDHRRYGGPLFLDATAHGLPLRHAISAEGQANYLICALRQLLPLAGEHDRMVLVCDKEIEADYVLLERLLRAFGARVSRLTIGRVPIGSQIKSSRFGGWESYLVDALTEMALREFDEPAYWLGMRLYFIGVLARESRQPFDPAVLRKQLRRAQRIIAGDGQPVAPETCREFVAGLLGDGGYVDPYRLTVAFNEKHKPVPVKGLLDEIFL